MKFKGRNARANSQLIGAEELIQEVISGGSTNMKANELIHLI